MWHRDTREAFCHSLCRPQRGQNVAPVNDLPSATLVESQDDPVDAAPVARFRLLVFSGDAASTHPIPVNGEVVVGRADECDVQVDVPALSRRHALVRAGPPMTVEDLGSSNGTKLRGRKLEQGERAGLQAGDAIEVGPVMLVVQRATRASLSSRPRRLWSHAYFEGRLEEECSRADVSGVPFSVLRFRLDGTAAPNQVQQVLAAILAPTDIIAAYGPGEYEAIVFNAKLAPLLKKISAELDKRDSPVTIGSATFGVDARDPDALFAEANAKVVDSTEDSQPLGSPFRIVIKDPQMESLHTLVKRVAQSDIPVLLLGETGVGKEVFAEAVHTNSARRDGPFLRLNCAALTESLLESELFGHEKGAFTGAIKAKPGLLESANTGTILLDEIGEMPLSTQAKLLRVLEQKEVIRVGDVRARPIDVRFVAATHRNLEANIEKGTFRQDLFFRLNGVSLVIPPLRERQAELEHLARFFIHKASKQYHRTPEPTLSVEALAMLKAYRWPGNLRELRNVLERSVLLCNGNVITADDLPNEKFTTSHLERVTGAMAPLTVSGSPEFEAERTRIMQALEHNGGNQTLAARAMGISRRTMLNRLDAYAIPRPRKGKG